MRDNELLAQPVIAQQAMPKGILILGAAKSGTTALFYAVRNALISGHAGSVEGLFEPRHVKEIGDYLRSTKDSVRLVKALLGVTLRHGGLDRLDSVFDRKIVIYRDPRDNIISRVCFMVSRLVGPRDEAKIAQVLEIFREKELNPSSISVTSMIQRVASIVERPNLLESVRNNSLLPAKVKREQGNRLFFMPYDDLVEGRFDLLNQYLGISVNSDFNVDERHSYVVRSKSSGAWKSWFLEEDVQFFARNVADDLRLLGFDPDDLPSEERKIQPKTGSEYVAEQFRRAQEKRKFRRADRSAQGSTNGTKDPLEPFTQGDSQSEHGTPLKVTRRRGRSDRGQLESAGRAEGISDGAEAAKRMRLDRRHRRRNRQERGAGPAKDG